MNHKRKDSETPVSWLDGYGNLNPNKPTTNQVEKLTSTFNKLVDIYTLIELQIIFKTYFETIPFSALTNDRLDARMAVLTELIHKLSFNTELNYSEITTILQTLSEKDSS